MSKQVEVCVCVRESGEVHVIQEASHGASYFHNGIEFERVATMAPSAGDFVSVFIQKNRRIDRGEDL